MRVPWTARSSSQLIFNPEYSLAGPLLKLKLPILWVPFCEELTHWKRPQCWERLKAIEEGDRRG